MDCTGGGGLGGPLLFEFEYLRKCTFTDFGGFEGYYPRQIKIADTKRNGQKTTFWAKYGPKTAKFGPKRGHILAIREFGNCGRGYCLKRSRLCNIRKIIWLERGSIISSCREKMESIKNPKKAKIRRSLKSMFAKYMKTSHGTPLPHCHTVSQMEDKKAWFGLFGAQKGGFR